MTSQQTEAPTGLNLGTGVRVVATDRQFSQGNLVTTSNPFDVAINGHGFFEILLPDGSQAYTRDGTFQINADGELVTSSGYAVQPAITIPQGAIGVTIGIDGVVTAIPPGQSDAVQVGTLQLTDFVNPAGLQPRGENLFAETHVERSAAARHAGLERPRHAGAGLARDVERQRRRGARLHDRDAACVRDELARDRDRRPDAPASDEQPVGAAR